MKPPPGGFDPGLDRRRAFGFFLLALLVFLVRLAIAARVRGNYDTDSFRIAAEAVLSGQNVYAATERYNYSPVWAYTVAGLWTLAGADAARFVFLLGLLATAADAAAAALVFALARRLGRTRESALGAALLFFANPVSVLASSAHGQFDGLAIVPLLGAILVTLGPGGLGDRRRKGWAAALLSASLLVKHVTAFHPLLFWRRVRRPGLSDAALAVPYAALALSFLPFAGAGSAIWENVVAYGARGAKPSAWTALLEIPRGQRFALFAILAAAVAWAISATRREELPRAALVLWLAVLVALPTYGIQYLVWPLAVGALYPSAGLGVYVFAAAIFHSSWSLDLAWPVQVSSLGTWLAAAFWLAQEAVGLRARGRQPQPAEAAAGESAA